MGSDLTAYRFLCGALGGLFVGVGLVCFAAFTAYHAPGSDVAVPTGPTGFYFVAFTGCALVAWGGCLLGAARRPEGGRSVGTATALGLVMCAVYRMLAWVVGDYYLFPGEVLRAEAALFLILALAFVWLRPSHPAKLSA
jgi:hypothetical protein